MFHDFINLLYPRICYACEGAMLRHEKVVCTGCLHALPLADLQEEEENFVEKIFFGRIPLENATSLLLFQKKGMVQKLIHNLKYRGHEEIGSFLGSWMGELLKERESFRSITAVIPVPLHKVKLRKRGFNQVTKFGEEIAASLQVPYVDDVLVKISSSRTQTLKKRIARWGSMEENFSLQNEEKLAHAHVLLVDDLVTTGATLEACAQKLLQVNGIKISVATMAVTG